MSIQTGDSYHRIAVSENTYQCGCHWEVHPEYGDVLVECPFHAECTRASVARTERLLAKGAD